MGKSTESILRFQLLPNLLFSTIKDYRSLGPISNIKLPCAQMQIILVAYFHMFLFFFFGLQIQTCQEHYEHTHDNMRVVLCINLQNAKPQEGRYYGNLIRSILK